MRNGYIAICFFALTALAASCKPDVKEVKGKLAYFDLKGFFHADSLRLVKRNPLVTKTVAQNGESQAQKVHITNWGTEFELFTNSDINKPAWRDSYTINSSDSVTVYIAKFPNLKTTRMVISKKGDKVKWILIYNHTKNMLFENTEKLTYFPDSTYVIVKAQQVRLLGKNLYKIKGVFN